MKACSTFIYPPIKKHSNEKKQRVLWKVLMVNREQKQMVSYNDKMLQMKELKYYILGKYSKILNLI